MFLKLISVPIPSLGHLLVTLVTLISFLALFTFRHLDDNSLTSWNWVFDGNDLYRILLLLILGVFAAFLFSRVTPPKAYRGGLLFIGSFAIGALFWSVPEVIVDTSRYFIQAKHLQMYGVGYFWEEWGRDIVVWTDLPLVPFLYGLIFKFLGESRTYIQIFITLLFSGTIMLTYYIGKTLWNEDVGFLGGLALLGFPYLLTQVPLMLVDIPTMFFFTLAVFVFIKALEKGGWGMILLSSLTIFLAVFSKYSAALMLSVLVVILLVYLFINLGTGELRSPQRIILYRGGIIAAVTVSFIGVMALYKLDVFVEQIQLLASYQIPGLERWGESFVSTFLFQIHPFIATGTLISMYVAVGKRDLRFAIISWLLIVVLLFGIERIRYLIIIFPMLALMAAYGLQAVKSMDMRKFIIYCAVFSSLIIAVFGYYPFLTQISSVNLKDAGEYLNSLEGESVRVFTLAPEDPSVNPAVSVPILDLFTNKNIIYGQQHTPPSWGKIKDSPLRFTWEHRNPEYYFPRHNKLEENMPLVLISNEVSPQIPDFLAHELQGYSQTKTFTTSTGVFLRKTYVTVYEAR